MGLVGRAAAIKATTRGKLKRKRVRREKARKIEGCWGNRRHEVLSKRCRAIRDTKIFQVGGFRAKRLAEVHTLQSGIVGVILLAGCLIGVQTYDNIDSTVLNFVNVLDSIVLGVFVTEALIKIAAEGNRPQEYFKDAWNNFDFTIVVVGVMPFGGQTVTVLRLVRLLRVLKLVRALPKLRILVMGLLKSLSSIAYIGLLLLLLFYLYAVLGVSVFSNNDPVHFGTLHIALLTLFRCATLEDWTDVMYIAMYGCENYGYAGIEDQCSDSSEQGLLAAVFFVSFIVLSSMMILNLFIGVITSSMQEAKATLTEELLRGEEDAERVDSKQESQTYQRVIEAKLRDLSALMNAITTEVFAFARLEKQRKAMVELQRNSVVSMALPVGLPEHAPLPGAVPPSPSPPKTAKVAPAPHMASSGSDSDAEPRGAKLMTVSHGPRRGGPPILAAVGSVASSAKGRLRHNSVTVMAEQLLEAATDSGSEARVSPGRSRDDTRGGSGGGSTARPCLQLSSMARTRSITKEAEEMLSASLSEDSNGTGGGGAPDGGSDSGSDVNPPT